MIKAIETKYKGFRFRSRVEARWAVFFEHLGVKWEYEPEGYKLSDGTPYLPDFRINGETFVEVKGEPIYRKMRRVYLAGEMKKRGDWRPLDIYLYSVEEYENNLKAPIGGDAYGHFYIGPYGIDECSGHGDGGHTDNLDLNAYPVVVDGAMQQIGQCDLFFAWLNSPDRYGTIAEIGYAKALGKEIWIGMPHNSGTGALWFCKQMADKAILAPTPEAAFLAMEGPLHPDEQKCLTLSKDLNCNVILLSGQPGMGDHFASWHSRGKIVSHGASLSISARDELIVLPGEYIYGETRMRLLDAHTAARSARFEHGEQG